jgi:hypothetical protein
LERRAEETPHLPRQEARPVRARHPAPSRSRRSTHHP